MRKGTYRSHRNRDVSVVIRVERDMTDAEFQFALEVAMGEPLVDQGAVQRILTQKQEG